MNKIDLIKILKAASLLMFLFLGTSMTYAQESTEQFIPIGMSPGISNKYSYIGSIIAVDSGTKTIIIESNRGTRTITVSPLTRIWIDRSKIKQSSLKASFNDCEVGRRVEIMHDREDGSVANWIKIEST